MKIDSNYLYTQAAFAKLVGLKNRQYINELIKTDRLEKVYKGAKVVPIHEDSYILYYPPQKEEKKTNNLP